MIDFIDVAMFLVIVFGLVAPMCYLFWLGYAATVKRARRKRTYIGHDRLEAALRRRGGL